MDDLQDYKRKLNYFRQSDGPRIVGLALALIGIILLFCSGYLRLHYVVVIFGWIALPVGVALFIVAASVRADEENIDKHIADQLLGLEISAAEEDRLRKRLLDTLHPRILEGYEYRQGLLLRKDKVSTVRSELFSRTNLYLLRDGLYLLTRTVSLINKEQKQVCEEICLNELKSVELREKRKMLTYAEKSFDVKDTRLVFTRHDGSEVSVPAHVDMELEQFVAKIYDWIDRGVVVP